MEQDYSHLVAHLREHYHYKPLTGELLRHERLPYRKPHGSHKSRYRMINVGGQVITMHRAVWLWFHGALPVKPLELDHINQDKHDNRISNLRAVSRSANNRNCHSKRGYYFRADRPKKPWAAQVGIDGVTYSKAFATEEEAKAWVRHTREQEVAPN